jgi:CRP-like cAMP-binding protein
MTAQPVNHDRLREADLFRNFDEAALRELAQHCRLIELAAGETLFEQGDPGYAMYILEAGQVHIVRRYASGDEVVLATEGPYYVIGELSMLAGQPRTGTVVAVSDCTLIEIQRSAFVRACASVAGAAASALDHLSARLYRMTLLVRENAVGNAPARIASVLLLLCGGQNGPVAPDVWVTRLARATAVDADMVERLLQEWSRLGYIHFDGRRLAVLDADRLHIIAG